MADIDLDGDLEVIFGNSSNGIDIRHHDGRLAPGWPQETNAEMRVTPAVGDIDGDGFPEIVAHSSELRLYAWKHEGTLLKGWPVATNGRVESPLSLADADGDGKLDHILCDRGVYQPNGERLGNGCGRSYRTKPEGVPETIAFSFVVTLRPDVDHACPGVRVSSPRSRKAVTHPDLGKPLLYLECPFGAETYQIASTRRFQVTAMNSSAARDYQFDPIIVGKDSAP